MEFETQRELLAYLGKCENDRSLVQRMIKRGEVYKRDGIYYLVDGFKKRSAGRLYDEIRELREEVNELKKSDSRGTISSAELEEAKIQWKYWEKECKRYGRLSLNVIDICYNKFKQLLGSRFQESKEDFKEGVIEMAKEMDKGGEKSD